MYRKFTILFFIISFVALQAQNEFITIWKPAEGNPPNINPAPPVCGDTQIWFPGIGTNYTITWEEIGFPQHNGTMTNVTSIDRVLIDFGAPFNPNSGNALYRVKVSNGNGNFNQIKFANNTIIQATFFDLISVQLVGSSNKIMAIEKWGNISWTSMNSAFTQCLNMQLTATDTPNLQNVEDASMMFYNSFNFEGNNSMALWNTSNIKNFKAMFGYRTANPTITLTDNFNPPIGSWNTSNVTDMSYMFMERKLFNQNINSWDVSKVTNMAYMFAQCTTYNQPLNNWNTSKVLNMQFMFHFMPDFNQPLDQWDTSKVTTMAHMFHGTNSFNQPLDSWDTSNVTDTNTMFTGASSFDQTLESWDLPSLVIADNMFLGSGINCDNFSFILAGWADNPVTANNVNLQSVYPLKYSSSAIPKKNILLGKGWSMTGDSVGECRKLGLNELHLENKPSIYPNPADDFIFLKNIYNVKKFIITDASGRIITQENLRNDFINIDFLPKGSYILQLITTDKSYSLKFIKK